jgi:integrase
VTGRTIASTRVSAGASATDERAPEGASDAKRADEEKAALMARPAIGTVERRQTKRGISYYLRLTWRDPATGGTHRVREHLGGEWEGWDERRVQEERELIAKLMARDEWLPRERRAPVERRAPIASAPKMAAVESFQLAASRHYDRRQRRMGSDKSREDLHWRLAVAVQHLGDHPVDAITEGTIDDMVDALLRERDSINQAAAAGAPLMEDYVDRRTARTHQRRRRGLANSSINKVVRAVRAVLEDAVRHRVVDFNAAGSAESLVRENGPQRSFLEPFQLAALLDAGRALEADHRGLMWDDVRAIRASTDSNVALARRYHVSDGLVSKVRRRELWVTEPVRNRNDVPRTVILGTLELAGLRISELCALDGEDLDFAGRRIYVPRLRNEGGRLVRVAGVKTEAAERVIPMLPALHDLLLDHKAEFDYGPHHPVFATRNGRRNTVDNVRRTVVDAAAARANELLAARGQREIARCTPHTLRRTFASILAEVNLPPRRAMYLLGHSDPTLTMRVYQQVIDMGDGGVQTLETVIGCTLAEAFGLFSGRGVLSTNCPPALKNASQPDTWSGLEGAETAR